MQDNFKWRFGYQYYLLIRNMGAYESREIRIWFNLKVKIARDQSVDFNK